MKKTILIPTDLSIASLNTLKIVLETYRDAPPQVILLYAEHLTDSISDLLFYSPEKILKSRITGPFREALEILKNRFERKAESITIRLFHGYNRNALSNFLDAYKVDEIYVPGNYALKTPGRAFDPVPMLSKLSMPVKTITWAQPPGETEQDQLILLFR